MSLVAFILHYTDWGEGLLVLLLQIGEGHINVNRIETLTNTRICGIIQWQACIATQGRGIANYELLLSAKKKKKMFGGAKIALKITWYWKLIVDSPQYLLYYYFKPRPLSEGEGAMGITPLHYTAAVVPLTWGTWQLKEGIRGS